MAQFYSLDNLLSGNEPFLALSEQSNHHILPILKELLNPEALEVKTQLILELLMVSAVSISCPCQKMLGASRCHWWLAVVRV